MPDITIGRLRGGYWTKRTKRCYHLATRKSEKAKMNIEAQTPPSANLLRSLLSYDPATGCLFWRERGVEHFGGCNRACRSWNARFQTKQAFTSANNHGYMVGSIFGRIFSAHRVIWAIIHGDWPSGQIDHINGDRKDNRIENLREVNNSCNHKNQKKPSTNKSGVVGVHMDARWGTWRAEIFDNGKRIHLGSFKCKAAATEARQRAEASLGYHPNHGRA